MYNRSLIKQSIALCVLENKTPIFETNMRERWQTNFTNCYGCRAHFQILSSCKNTAHFGNGDICVSVYGGWLKSVSIIWNKKLHCSNTIKKSSNFILEVVYFWRCTFLDFALGIPLNRLPWCLHDNGGYTEACLCLKRYALWYRMVTWCLYALLSPHVGQVV